MDFTRLFDIIQYQQKSFPQPKCLGYKVNGKWKHFSTNEVINLANRVSLGLLKMGLKKGDTIALISYNNRPEWNIMDIGMQQIGVVNVPVYPTISPREYEYIFNDAKIKYAFVGHGDLVNKVSKAQQNIPSLQEIITFDPTEGYRHWESIFEEGDMSEVQAIMDGIKEEDLATLIYTSGTTGNPKGVMLSHKNIASNVRDVYDLLPVEPGDYSLSFLPLCHVFERTVTYSYMSKGINIHYAESIETIGDNLKEVKPHFFTTVPRLLEKVYEKIYNTGLTLTGLKKSLFFWALSLTEDYEYDKQYGFIKQIQLNIADKLIFSKWREALGGRIKGIVTGAAACPRKMAQVFSAAGVPIREGYGLTESSPGLAIGRFSKHGGMLGTVGPALNSVTLKLAEDGEILAKGPNIMQGYLNLPEKTAEVLTEDGWLHTGDIGTFIDGPNDFKYLKITDRKKELLKTSGGKYVAPAPIENKFKESFLIEQLMVVGEKRKFVSALILPAFPALHEWASDNGITFEDREELVNHPKVVAQYERIVKEFNPEFSKIEQIKKFKLLTEEWTVESGELTPTMKLKRRVIREKFARQIEDIYNV